MKGYIRNVGPNCWQLFFDLPRRLDPATGRTKRRQGCVTFHGTKKEAEAKLTDTVNKVNKREYVDATKLTVGDWLDTWFAKAIEPAKRPRKVRVYRDIIGKYLKPALGTIRLQDLSQLDIEKYYADRRREDSLSEATLQLHHSVVSSALKSAVKKRLVPHNEAADVEAKPHREATVAKSWMLIEARRFLAEAQTHGPQVAAFYALALDSGARSGELHASSGRTSTSTRAESGSPDSRSTRAC